MDTMGQVMRAAVGVSDQIYPADIFVVDRVPEPAVMEPLPS